MQELPEIWKISGQSILSISNGTAVSSVGHIKDDSG